MLVPPAEFARVKGISEDDLGAFLKNCSEKLLRERSKRVRPQLDDKILLGWNALMNIALSEAAAAFSEPAYRDLAVTNLEFLWSKFRTGDDAILMQHTFKNGTAKYPAFLDDYAYFIKACIKLQEVTSDVSYLQRAFSLTETVIENFVEENNDYFFYTGKSQEDIIVRKTEIYDGAIPSGNSVMTENLFYLSVVFDKVPWKLRAGRMLNNLSDIVTKYPTSFANWACILVDQVTSINEIAVVGNKFITLRDELLTYYIPNRVLQSAAQGNGTEFPLLSGKPGSEEPLVYLCRNYSCKSPEKDINLVISDMMNSINFNNNYNN